MSKKDLVLKRNKDFLDFNTKLETSVCILKSDLDKTNLSLQNMILEKSKLDEHLRSLMIKNKY